MSSSLRVVSIFGVVAALAAGSGYYYFKVFRPNQVKKAVQAEVTAWEGRFGAARDCLLGKKPGSSKTSEALAIREMAPDPWDRGRCTPLISKLTRGDAPDTGVAEIEAEWLEIDKAASKAALAFATHVGSSTTLKQDPLPAALDNLDATRAKLRELAGLPAAEQLGKPLVVATLVPLSDNGEAIREITVDSVPSAHGMVLFGQAKRPVQIVLTTGGKPQVGSAAGIVRGVPDATWGAGATDTDVQIGAFDANGMITTPSLQKIKNGVVAAVIGTLANGEVVYGDQTSLVVARTKAGAVAVDPPIAIANGDATTDVDGRAALVWHDAKNKLFGRLLVPGADEPVIELGEVSGGRTCLTKDRVWIDTGTAMIGFGGGRPMVSRPVEFKVMLGCTPDAVLLRELDQRKPLMICTDDCRSVAMPTGAPEFATTTTVGGKLVAVASHGGVLGVWREGIEPAFFSLPEVADPVMAHEWRAMALTDGRVIDILARGATSFVVIRIPASAAVN